jgi:predicted dinucleotide-binding enzyme
MARIGIIGSGNVGGALTRLFTKAGHDVVVANSRGPASLADLARETGARPVTVAEAVQNTEIVVIALPMAAVSSLPKDLFHDAPAHLIVIDTSNYYPKRDGLIEPVEAGMTESGWVERQLGHPVIKAFNFWHKADIHRCVRVFMKPKRYLLSKPNSRGATLRGVCAERL